MSNLTNVMDVKKRPLESLESNYTKTRKTISNLVAENEKLHQSYVEGLKEMDFSIQEQLLGICNDNELMNLELQRQEKELQSRSIELHNREVAIAMERNKLAKEIKQSAANDRLLQTKEKMVKLTDSHKREMENLQEKISYLEKQVNDGNQMLLQEMKHLVGQFRRDHRVKVHKKTANIVTSLNEKEEERKDLEILSQTLVSQDQKNNVELQDARDELIKMTDVARGHDGDGGGEDPLRPPPVSFGCGGCFVNRGKGKRKPNLGGVKAGRRTREKTRNQQFRDALAANKNRPLEIGFDEIADNSVVPTGLHAQHWGNIFAELVRGIPLRHPSWLKVPEDEKTLLMARLGNLYNLEPHRRSPRWDRVNRCIQGQFTKSYNTNKATLKREHWIKDPNTGAYDLEAIRRGKPDEYTAEEWEEYIKYWSDPTTAQRAATNSENRSKSKVISHHGSRSIPRTRYLMREASETHELPSEIDTFYRLHTVGGVFDTDESRQMYDRMRELEQTGEHTTSEINRMVRGGKQRGHIPGVGQVLPAYVTSRPSSAAPPDINEFMWNLLKSDKRYKDKIAQYESGGTSGSGKDPATSDGEDGEDGESEDGGDDTS